MSDIRKRLNPVPDSLRSFARQQRSTMPKAEDLILTSVALALDEVLAALQQHGPSPCLPSAGCPSPAEGGGILRGDTP